MAAHREAAAQQALAAEDNHQDQKHRAQGQDQPELLADDAEDQVGVGRADVFQEHIVPRPLAEEAAAGDGGHGTGLLEAPGVGGVLPHMAPGPEAVGNVGLELEDHPSPRPGGGGHKAHKPNVPRPEEGDDQQGHKEDEGGTKVTHQGQAAQAYAGEQDEQPQVPLVEEPLQGG